MEDAEFEVTATDCHRWARGLRTAVDADPRETEENRMKILCAYLLYCFADTIREDMPGGTRVVASGMDKELN